jgi:hypothetical protein
LPLLPLPFLLYLLLAARNGADVVATDLKAKLYNLGLSLKDNTQPQFPVAVSSLSSSSKAPLTVVKPKSAKVLFLTTWDYRKNSKIWAANLVCASKIKFAFFV